MDQDASFHDAKRLYLESCGDPMVTNTYLKIALALLSIVCVALALIDLRTIRTFQNFRPLVIRIDDLGRAEAINYHNLEYKPQDAEAKYFLSEFCALYYRRNRYTIQDEFSKPTARTTSLRDSSRIPLRPRWMWTSRRSRSKKCRPLLFAPVWTSTWSTTPPRITAS